MLPEAPKTPFLRISRSMARSKGLKRYYTGSICKYGHDAERWIGNGGCTECQKIKDKGARSGTLTEINIRAAAERAAKIPKIPVLAPGFEWTTEVRAQLLDAYVDSGSIESARETVGLTPSEYHRELERNPEFSDAIAKATILAIQTLEDRLAHAAMIKGDLKAHIPLLKAKRPEEYSERVRVDQTTTHLVKLSNDELDKRIARYTSIDAEFSDAQAEAGPAAAPGGEGPKAVAQSHSNAVSGNGAAQPR